MNKHFRNTVFAFVCFTLAAPAMAMAGTGSVSTPGLGHSRVASDQGAHSRTMALNKQGTRLSVGSATGHFPGRIDT